MPQFAVHFVENSGQGVTLFKLPSFEAYGELSETLHDARAFATSHAYKTLRVWLCRVDFQRLREQSKLSWDAGRAKLNDEKVRQIRQLYSSGTRVSELSEMYGVSKGTISDVVHRRKWTHVESSEYTA